MKISPAAYASNWRRVLMIDAMLGVIVILVGIALIIRWNGFFGSAIAVVGFVYVLLVGRRFLQWRWLRQQRDNEGEVS